VRIYSHLDAQVAHILSRALLLTVTNNLIAHNRILTASVAITVGRGREEGWEGGRVSYLNLQVAQIVSRLLLLSVTNSPIAHNRILTASVAITMGILGVLLGVKARTRMGCIPYWRARRAM